MMTGSDQRKDFRVAIVGGGMCGLLTAIGLSRAGIEVDVFEAATSFREIGAGVGIGPNAVRALGELGVLDTVLEHIKPEMPAPRPFCFISGSEGNKHIYDYPADAKDAGLPVHRAIFLEALSNLFDATHTHFNKRCIAVREAQTQTSTHGRSLSLDFADGTNAEADVMIGADGVRSIVRTYVAGDECDMKGPCFRIIRAAFTNTLAYRGLVEVKKLEEAGMRLVNDLVKLPYCLTGNGKHIILFPIKNHTVLNVVAFACDRSVEWGDRPFPPGQPWVGQRTTEELLDTYHDYSEDIKILLRCLPNPSVWAIHAVSPPLHSYTRGRVALVGDSAHGMLPHLGAGVGQGIEDSHAIVRLLAHPKTTLKNVEDALQAYDDVRRERAHAVHAASTRAGDIYEGFGPSGPDAEGMRKDLVGIWDMVWHYDIEAAVDAQIHQLEEVGILQ